MSAILRADGLKKSYGDLRAADGVSFELRRGETFGLLGPNGAGKTTTLHLLIGALRPDGGQLAFDGQSGPGLAPNRRRIGIAPQSLALVDQLTGKENLLYCGRIYGLHGKILEDRVSWALDFAGLTDRAADRADTYSGGMQRRLNLACGVVHNPDLLLLDEPTVGVDPQSRSHIFESIEELKEKGLTVLYTTHYMEEAQRLCDRVAIMDQGRILDHGGVDELIERHGGLSSIVVELEDVPADPSGLPGTLTGTTLVVETEQPMESLADVIESDLRIKNLTVRRPDLEEVFLSLTGRTLRD